MEYLQCKHFLALVLIWVLFVALSDAEDENSSEIRKLAINSKRNVSSTRRRMLGSSSQPKPIFIRLRKPEQKVTGRRVPDVPPPNVSESSILRIDPVIRFHHAVEPPALSNTTSNPVDVKKFLMQTGLIKMADLLEESGVIDDLVKLGPATLFVPTDDAFQLAPRGTIETMLEEQNKSNLKDFLLNHVIRGHLDNTEIRNDFTMPSVHPSGNLLRFNIYNDGQVITVSGAQFLNSAKVVGNLLIQPVDRIIYPTSDTDLPERIRKTFNWMYSLLRQSGLLFQLSSGTFTVFVPTDEAFETLSPKAKDVLLRNSTLLRKVVLSHIVPGSYFSTVLANGYKLKSLSGEGLLFTSRRGLIMVNSIPLIKQDIPTNNGVLHVINRLIVPEEVAEQCQCMPKYPMAPATLRPVPNLGVTSSNGKEPPDNGQEASSFGERIRAPQAFGPDSPGGMPDSLNGNRPQPTVFQLLSSPVILPDGRMITFGTANRLFRKSLLFNSLQKNGATKSFTILLPTDGAFRLLPPESMLVLQRSPATLRKVLELHVLEGTLDPEKLSDKEPVKTLGGSTLIVNILPGANTILVGGVKVLSTRSASNGAVFAVDRVLDSSATVNETDNGQFEAGSPTSIKAQNPEDVSLWRRLIEELPDVKKRLKSRQDVFTMFVPTNAAFAKLPPEQLRQLLNQESLKRDLILSHVVMGAYIKSMISPGQQVSTLRGPLLTFDLIPGGFTVNNAPVVKPGRVTSNGIVYIVDRLLRWPSTEDNYRSMDLPHTVADLRPLMSLDEIAQKYNATIFMKWVSTSGVRDRLRNIGHCTLFLPTNTAILSMSPTLRMATTSDPRALRRLVEFHVCVIPVMSKWNFASNDMLLPTLLPKKSIRCNSYDNGAVVTASGCPVQDILPPSDEDISVVVLNGTLAPPVGNVFLTASKSPLLRNFTKILRVAGMEAELTGNGPFTVFAPSKCAFASMPPERYQQLIESPDEAREFISRHIVRSCYYTSGLTNQLDLTTIGGQNLHFETPPGCITVNGKKLKYGDLGATNGVLHIVSDIL